MQQHSNARWRTSTYTAANEACVEVAPVPDSIAVRDSKDRANSPVLAFSGPAWAEFLGTVKTGKLDL